MRIQNPELQKTAGKNARWFIRPYVDTFDSGGRPARKKERIYLGGVNAVPKREAIRKKNEVLETINRRQFVMAAQVKFGEFLDHYEREYVRKPGVLGSGTQQKYLSLLKNHIRPALGEKLIAEISTRSIEQMLDAKTCAHSTKLDIRNLISGVFSQAIRWGIWKERNPAEYAIISKRNSRPAREKRKLTDEQTRDLLAALPYDVRLIVQVALFCGCRISEVLGLQWKHVDFERRLIMIRQRFYRGDIDLPKTRKSKRDLPLGFLIEDLRLMWPGEHAAEDYVFSVQTHVGRYRVTGHDIYPRDSQVISR